MTKLTIQDWGLCKILSGAELWRDIEGYEGRFKGKYQVSNQGRIRSVSRRFIRFDGRPITIQPKIRKLYKNRMGYFKISLDKQLFSVHRLVAEAFVQGLPFKPQVNHKNGIKTDNRANNLEWCTASENQLHAYKIGLKKAHPSKGSKHGRSKLTEIDVLEIREKFEPYVYTTKMLAKEYGVCETSIKNIVKRRSWKHV